MEPGKVYLIGAGPGDAGLITVKGKECLEKADVVLYDRLVNPLLLESMQEQAERIYCGKLPERHHLRQEAIQQLLIDKAEAGLRVVRLKGGDPGMFGRVGEETEALAEAGVPYELVPGITAGLAAPLYAGIPITHRDFSGSFAAVTGHTKTPGGSPAVNWKTLAEGIDTIAFYMGIKNLGLIAEQLIAHGRPQETPAAVIEWAATGRQRVCEATLGTIKEEVDKKNIQNPAITLVGDVASFHRKLHWLEKQPLFGRYIWVVNPASDENENAGRYLREGGAEVFDSPILKVDTSDTKPLYNIERYSSLVFASEYSVPVFFEELRRAEIDVRDLPRTITAISEPVVHKLKEFGILPGKAAASVTDNHTLWIGPNEASSEETVYDQWVSHKLSDKTSTRKTAARLIQDDLINTVVLPSPEAVHILWKELDSSAFSPVEWLTNKPLICYDAATAQAAEAAGMKVEKTLRQPDEKSLVESLIELPFTQ